jgi:predicted ester cyclase
MTMASNAENVVRSLIENGFNEGDLEIVDAITSPDLVEHQNFGPDHAPGAPGVRAVVESLRRAFPDFRLAIEDLVADGDTVWLRMVATGTNEGSFMGHAPTGRQMRVDVFDAIRVENGRMVEHWGVPDRLGALLQLGLAGPPAAAAA